jgi:excinuclease UvrABC helicase subunit UvrB
MVVSYKDNPDKFKEVLSDIKKYRIEYMNKKLTKLDNAFDKLKSDIVDYISNDCRLNSDREFDFSRWEIKEAITMLSSDWTPDSSFFDNQEFTSKIQYLEERLDKPEEAMRQYLVPVDFHF